MKKRSDLTGQQFGRWTVLHRDGNMSAFAAYMCRCACGTAKRVPSVNLTRGLSTSCGCYRRERGRDLIAHTHGSKGNLRHGHARRSGWSKEYYAWSTMKARCGNPRHDAYPWYGGSGIEICSRWEQSFDAFLADMGSVPSEGMDLVRIDKERGYYPGNVVWAFWVGQKEPILTTEHEAQRADP